LNQNIKSSGWTPEFDKTRQLLNERLNPAMSGIVNYDESQFLELDGSYFAEIVLNDATVLQDVREIVRQIAAESKVRLAYLVRAKWKVIDARFVGPAIGKDGGLRAASVYHATLLSGSLKHVVSIEVGNEASRLLHNDTSRIAKLVTEHLENQLAAGGTSSWDPVISPAPEINRMTVQFLTERGQKTTWGGGNS